MIKNLNLVFFLVGAKFKYFFYFLIIFMFFSGILELLGISLLIPIMIKFFDTEVSSSSLILDSILNNSNFFLFDSINKSLLILIIFFLFKNVVSITAIYLNYFFSFKISEKLRILLLDIILKKKYSYFLDKDMSSITAKIYNHTQHVSNNFINPILSIVSEFFILLFLLSLLFLLEFKGTLVVFSFFSFIIFIYVKLINKKFKKLGLDLNFNDKFLFKYLEQSFGNLKETLIYNRQNYFENKFSFYQRIITKVSRNYLTFQQIPRIFLEIVVLLSITFLIFFMIYIKADKSLVIIKLGIFSAVAFKILPSINRMVFSYHALKFGKPLVKSILDDIQSDNFIYENNNKVSIKKIQFNRSIIFSDVCFEYLNNKKGSQINNINFEIIKGDTVLITGKTGGGKSTLVDLMTGLLDPSSGKILIDNTNLSDVKKEWQKIIGYVAQQVYLTDASIKENIIYDDNDNFDKNLFLKSLKDSDIYDYIQELPEKENTLCGEKGLRFSGGQKQRIAIARALYRDPSILIMDEATSGLDKETEDKLFNNLKKRGITIIIISHNLTLKKFSNKIITIDNGSLI